MAARWINFKDSNSDQHAYKVEHLNAIFITAPTTIKVYVRNADNPSGNSPLGSGVQIAGISDDIITITTTAGKAERILKLKLLRPISSLRSNRPVHISSDITDITTVAHAAGT
jgi:hypothetical protein